MQRLVMLWTATTKLSIFVDVRMSCAQRHIKTTRSVRLKMKVDSRSKCSTENGNMSSKISSSSYFHI